MGIIDSAIDSFKTGGQCLCIEAASDLDDLDDLDLDPISDVDSDDYELSDGIKSDSNNIDHKDETKESSGDAHLAPMSIFEAAMSSSLSYDEPIPSDIKSLVEKEESGKSLSHSSKMMMHLSHMIVLVLKEYFESPANQCEFGDIELHNILKHIYIIGDSPRNYLLGIAMENHIDIIVNTRELSKLHLEHLNTYHHTEEQQTSYSQCILWNHYLNKLDTKCIQSDITLRNKYNNNAQQIAHVMKSIEYISQSEYILNANFITSILIRATRFENKLSIYQHKYCASFQVQIIDELRYGKGDISLNGCNFHIFDHNEDIYSNIVIDREKIGGTISEFHGLQRKKLIRYKQQNKVHLFMEDMIKTPDYDDDENKHMRLSTRRVFDPSDIQGVNGFKRVEFVIPKYRISVSKVIANYDISLNFFVVPFSNIIDVLNEANELDQNDDEIEIDYDWNSKIKNGVNKYDSFNDLSSKIITHPFPNKMVSNIKSGFADIYFWRLIKISMQCIEYQIDKKIVKIIKDYYKEWIQNEAYDYEDLLNALFGVKLCCSWIDFKTMLEKFDIFDFNTVLIGVLHKSNDFKKRFISELNDQDNDVIDLFEEYNYPID